MKEKLTYEEWRDRYCNLVPRSDEEKEELKQLHGINVDEEIESALRKEYELYLLK